jgi:hypothetical protein
VGLPVPDFTSGFTVSFPGMIHYFYQSVDCTGQAYLSVTPDYNNLNVGGAPPIALVATIPPSTEPYIYFAGTPALVTIYSEQHGGNCGAWSSGQSFWVGPIQSVPVSSLGLTLPFKVK